MVTCQNDNHSPGPGPGRVVPVEPLRHDALQQQQQHAFFSVICMGMTLNKCATFRIGTMTGGPLCREGNPLYRLHDYFFWLSSCKNRCVHLLIILRIRIRIVYWWNAETTITHQEITEVVGKSQNRTKPNRTYGNYRTSLTEPTEIAGQLRLSIPSFSAVTNSHIIIINHYYYYY